MKPDIKAIKERLKKVTNVDDAYEEINASMESVRDVPDLLDYIADLEAVVSAIKKRNVVLKKCNEITSVPNYGYVGNIYDVAKEKRKIDDELSQALAKLDGDKDG